MFGKRDIEKLKRYFDPKLFELIISGKIPNQLFSQKVYLSLIRLNFNLAQTNYDIESLIRTYAKCVDMILDNGATIDGLYGFSILFYYNHPSIEPKHPTTAAGFAIKLISHIIKMNSELNPSIGIHTGDAVVSNLGSNRMFQYKVFGDNVGLANHLAFMGKGPNILISEDTYKMLEGEYIVKDLGKTNYMGKEIKVFELLMENMKPGV